MSFDSFVPFTPKLKLPCVLFAKADWCGHCHHMAPVMQQAQSSMKNVPVYIVDADTNPKIIEKLKVQGFPTVFVVGANRRMHEYDGARDPASIVAFVKKWTS